MKRNGFTLLEVLVASVLRGMLVTILTMIFNQSAIAWRTGKAGVADMTETERNLSKIHYMADNVLPYTRTENYCVVSPWDDANSADATVLQRRGIRTASSLRKGLDYVSGGFYNADAGKNMWSKSGLGSPKMDTVANFVVGVRSYGPDRLADTEDDITTWPDEVE